MWFGFDVVVMEGVLLVLGSIFFWFKGDVSDSSICLSSCGLDVNLVVYFCTASESLLFWSGSDL